MIGYKAFTEDLKCRDFQFAENETFEIEGPLEICKNGFHFCDVPINVFNYYYGFGNNKYAIIEALGEIQSRDDKLATNKIRIIKIISKQELINQCGNNKFITKSGIYQFKNNLSHSIDDLPARINSDGIQKWYKDGLLHRDNDLPAVIHINGDQLWYQNGFSHRDNDLPAKIYIDGTQKWYNDGKLHRGNDLPAIIYKNGIHKWYVNSILQGENSINR